MLCGNGCFCLEGGRFCRSGINGDSGFDGSGDGSGVCGDSGGVSGGHSGGVTDTCGEQTLAWLENPR